MKIKILNIVGARPQFIKAAAISHEIKKRKNIKEVIIHSGQHYDTNMSKSIWIQLFKKPPNYLLKSGAKNEINMITYIMQKIFPIMIKELPDWILVYGDTSTTIAAALVARKLNIRVAHIEAGVRNFDDFMPEEINRYITDRISTINFCVTKIGFLNLKKEGFMSNNINSKSYIVGDVMLDVYKGTKPKLNFINKILSQFKIISNNYILITIHRSSNVDNKKNLSQIIKALNYLSKFNQLVFLVHPRTQKMIDKFRVKCNFELHKPLPYKESISLILKSKFVITDSGGVVREAYFSKKQSLVILEKPVWPELCINNYSINTPPESSKIIKSFKKLTKFKVTSYKKIFGSGDAAKKIINKLIINNNKII